MYVGKLEARSIYSIIARAGLEVEAFQIGEVEVIKA